MYIYIQSKKGAHINMQVHLNYFMFLKFRLYFELFFMNPSVIHVFSKAFPKHWSNVPLTFSPPNSKVIFQIYFHSKAIHGITQKIL